jgi:hypothetical protein
MGRDEHKRPGQEVARSYLHNSRDITASFLQDSDDVLTAHLRFIRNASLDEVALFVSRDLTRHIYLGARDNGLRLRVLVSKAREDSIWSGCSAIMSFAHRRSSFPSSRCRASNHNQNVKLVE